MLRANVHVTSPALVLNSTRAALPDLRFEVAYQAIADVVFLTVEGDALDTVERHLAEDPTVKEFVRSAEFAGRRVYKLTLNVDRQVISEVAAELGISVTDTHSDPGDVGWTFEMLIPDRDALVALREFCVDHDMEFRLDRLFYSGEERAAGGAYDLTEKQRETLLAAYENGYFDVPRGISQQELADLLDSSPTAVSQRIRRAVTRLIENTVADDDGDGDE